MEKFGGKSRVFLRASTACCAASLSFFLLAGGAQAAPQGLLTRHTRDVVTQGQALASGRLSGSQSLRLNIALPLRNQLGLNSLIQQLYNPQSPSFRQYLTVSEFTKQFGPTEDDYNKVVAFAEANGLTVAGTSPNRLLLDVTGPVSSIEKAFNITINSYQDPSDGLVFYAPDREPTADLSVQLWHITGLDSYAMPHPASLHQSTLVKPNLTGSGPGGQYLGSDMRAAYYGGTALSGNGQSVGLLEYAGYNINDVTTYFTKAKQPLNVTITGVSVDGSSLSCTGSCDDTEQVLDIDQAISMAPAMDSVLVYVSDTSDVAMFNRMATDNIAKQLSCSWTWRPADPASDDPIFQEFAMQGQTLFTASGDSGSYSKRTTYVYPSDDAYLTSVGGTDLITTGPGGAWVSETGWSDSGGGISPDGIAIPSYQTAAGVITAGNKGSTTLRNSPDVAAEANFDNYVCSDGGVCEGGWGGTSFAAPRWAGLLALINQRAVSHAHATIGFLNPIIYPIALGSTYSSYFHDITSGSNGGFTAQTGFDLVTGWGSPNGSKLAGALVP